MNRLAIIGTSHTEGGYKLNSDPDKFTGWCADIHDSYDIDQTWVFSHGGGGLEETILYLQLIKDYWPENFFTKIVVEISTEPRFIRRTTPAFKIWDNSIDQFEIKKCFIISQQMLNTYLRYSNPDHEMANIVEGLRDDQPITLRGGFEAESDNQKYIKKYAEFKTLKYLINDNYFSDFVRVHPYHWSRENKGKRYKCSFSGHEDEWKKEFSSNKELTEYYEFYHFTPYKQLLLQTRYNSLRTYQQILNTDILAFLYNGKHTKRWIEFDELMPQQESYIDYLQDRFGHKKVTTLMCDLAEHLTAEGQVYLTNDFLKPQLDNFFL